MNSESTGTVCAWVIDRCLLLIATSRAAVFSLVVELNLVLAGLVCSNIRDCGCFKLSGRQ
jgi:hypothetical protein